MSGDRELLEVFDADESPLATLSGARSVLLQRREQRLRGSPRNSEAPLSESLEALVRTYHTEHPGERLRLIRRTVTGTGVEDDVDVGGEIPDEHSLVQLSVSTSVVDAGGVRVESEVAVFARSSRQPEDLR